MQYEFQLISGDGSRLRREHYALSDPRTAWDHIFVMAKTYGAPGSEVHVLDDGGEVVIRVGVATAAALARASARRILANPPA